jgi:nifR3 family TIM-barrel protein
MNFWKELKKEKGDSPIIVIAPMADVTDVAFRILFAKYGKPDVMWTEFVSSDGLMRAPDDNVDDTGLSSKGKLLKDLEYGEGERPIVAQLFSGKPEMMRDSSRLAKELGFDGIDINMGCPDRSIEKQGSGAGLIKDPERAKELILAAREGSGLPVTVKTRTGYNNDDLENWLRELLSVNPDVITIHARTRKEMSKVPANWDRIKRAVEIRDEMGSDTLIFGNGDVLSLKDAKEKSKETGCDGVMVGRAIFGDPWFFNEDINKEDLSIEEILRVMVEHTYLFEKLLSHKNFYIMKKHYKAYCNNFDGAKELRSKLMDTAKSAKEVEEIVEDWILSNN